MLPERIGCDVTPPPKGHPMTDTVVVVEYPKMLYSRQHAKNGHPGTYSARHDHVAVIVASEVEEDALGAGWVTDHTALPPRGDEPLHAAPVASPAEALPNHPSGFASAAETSSESPAVPSVVPVATATSGSPPVVLPLTPAAGPT